MDFRLIKIVQTDIGVQGNSVSLSPAFSLVVVWLSKTRWKGIGVTDVHLSAIDGDRASISR